MVRQNTELYPFQKKGVRKMIHFGGRALLADEQGLGKTIQALEYCARTGGTGPIVVICPAVAKWVWYGQALEHYGKRGIILEGQKPPRWNSRAVSHKRKIYILNYEIAQYWVKWLKKLKPDILIIDECHYIKNRGTNKKPVFRTRAVKKIAKKIVHVLALSGTPLVNRPAELYTTLNMLRPDIFNSFFDFTMRYCDRKKTRWGWEYKGATHLNELHALLTRTCMIRRLKKNVLKDLPEKQRIPIPLQLSNKDLREYRKASTNLIRWLGKRNPKKAKSAKKAEQLVRLGYLKRLAAELKYKLVCQWIDDWLEQNDGKLIVFGIHKKILRPLYERYKNQSVIIDGKVRGKKRRAAEMRFQKSKKIRLIFGNIQAAGTAITLTAGSTVVFTELDWSPGNMNQAEDRAHRITQKNAVLIYYLIAKNTIEEKLCTMLQTKQEILSEVLDGNMDENKMDLLNKEMTKSIRRTLLGGYQKGKAA